MKLNNISKLMIYMYVEFSIANEDVGGVYLSSRNCPGYRRLISLLQSRISRKATSAAK